MAHMPNEVVVHITQAELAGQLDGLADKYEEVAQGWPPPLAWDDDDIDNPDASPANWKEAA